MRTLVFFLSLCGLMTWLLLPARCTMGHDVPAFAREGCIVQPVRDTLRLLLPPELEDEVCSVSVRRHDALFTGRETVREGQVWFALHRFPAGTYTAWIHIGPYSFTEKFLVP